MVLFKKPGKNVPEKQCVKEERVIKKSQEKLESIDVKI
jgi:hypothetical protein